METETLHPEVLLISAVIQTGDTTTPGEAGIDPEHFHTRRVEWEWLEKFKAKFRKAPDKATFRNQFPDFPLLKTTDLDHGIEAVRKSHLRHTLTKSLNDSTRLLVADRPEEALEKIHSSISGMQHDAKPSRNILTEYSDVFREAARRVESASSKGLAGVNSGFHTLNDRTGGAQPGDLWIIATRLNVGKTWNLVKMGTTALMEGAKVVFVSLEQTKAQIAFRYHTMLAAQLGYSLRNRELMSGVNLDLNHYRTFLAELPERVPGELVICDPSTRGRVSPYTLATLIEAHDPDVVFVDYITLMKKESDEWQGVAKLSQDTKEVALQYGVPIICAAQINRLGEGGQRPPSVDKLSQSDSIGQDADVVVTGRKYSSKARQWLLAKNRSGSNDIVFYTSFDPDRGLIDEISYEEAMRLSAEAAIEEED